MNKWILIPLALIAIPFVVVYMWVRHPVLIYRELRDSFRLCVLGKIDDKD